MPTNLILVGKSGASAARSSLEMTAQNIANADNQSYVRRTTALAEVVSTGGINLNSSTALGGVRIDRIVRADSHYLQAEVRRTAAALTRSDAEIGGLLAVQDAIEQAGIYPAMARFEASLAQLASDPLSPSLRTAVVEQARTLAQSFGPAVQSMDGTRQYLQTSASERVSTFNNLAGEMARTNLALSRTTTGTTMQAALFDQRDALLSQMSEIAGIVVAHDPLGRATVRIGDSAGPVIVTGRETEPLSMAIAPDGTLSFLVAGGATSIQSGALAGEERALARMVDLRSKLDDAAASLVFVTNDAQANGLTPAGIPGPALFSGTGARDIALALTDGAQLATAPAGSGSNSRSIVNLEALRSALASTTPPGSGPASLMDGLLLDLSSNIAGRTITREALRTLADGAQSALTAQTGVDLDTEAANLVRFEQAFQASGRVIQVAVDIFDTLLEIR
ncbi:flagellar hook-associated protein FlgK [Croceicoccus sp. F390]|uniref:Flagellar hook-associated protein 1 n=1 Tax=Croceicoccus esteveae TaxID=3075597 RepID=A0ABU2ZF39_9SPHN|nr:flagellar hook-associated protein FlgK [Croceicoccus sp. F390]MDT0574698.1 flagellar hook-associated protein FlgK [Croceicoccus sp. F390]